MKTMEHIILEINTQKFIDKLAAKGGTPLYKLPIPEARKVFDAIQAESAIKIDADIEDLKIPGGPIGEISIRIVRPKNSKGKQLPVSMFFHGGGWICGNKETHDRLVRELANGGQTAIVIVNFTNSPEAKFPVPIEQAYAATKYIKEQGSNHNLNTSRLAVMGDSVGGNMATVVAMLAKERKGPKIDYQLLLYPVTDANFENGSYQQFAEGPWLTKEAMKWFWNAYEPNVSNRKDPHVTPLNATIEQLKGMPPALVITDENDVLRDEGEAYAHKLMQAGVEVAAVRFLGTHHDFMLLNAIAKTPATRTAIELVCLKLRNLFNNS